MGYAGQAGSTHTMTEPLYRQIMADIRDRIASGRWTREQPLPSTPDLVALYTREFDRPVSVATVRLAVTILIEMGELRGPGGKGVYIADY